MRGGFLENEKFSMQAYTSLYITSTMRNHEMAWVIKNKTTKKKTTTKKQYSNKKGVGQKLLFFFYTTDMCVLKGDFCFFTRVKTNIKTKTFKKIKINFKIVFFIFLKVRKVKQTKCFILFWEKNEKNETNKDNNNTNVIIFFVKQVKIFLNAAFFLIIT